jgi:hypothetical protein
VDRDVLYPDRELKVVRSKYDPSDDWEVGVIERFNGDFTPLVPGDHVIIRAGSGGKAGADVSRLFGEARETLVVVDQEEIVTGVLELRAVDE